MVKELCHLRHTVVKSYVVSSAGEVVHAVSCSSTPVPSIFPLSSADWMVLKALEKSKNMTLTVLLACSR